MRTPPVLLTLPVALAFVGGAVVLAGPSDRAEADASEKRVATSICEGHELKALQESNPRLEIEIPAEFKQIWPTAEACRSYVAAGDPDAPGPLQPIAFSHKHHAGLYEIECLYCHSGTDRSPAAGVPSVELCMGCHSQFPPTYDSEFEGIEVLKEHWKEQRPIEWEQVYRLPEHVQFRHNRHIQAGFDCQTCHGPVEEMDKFYMTSETHWWPWLLPTSKPEMGWCIDCHRQNGATQDCYTCHY
jgi:hypothetical protein